MASKHLADVECPYCGKPISISKEVEVISPGVPAERIEKYTAERIVQMTLDPPSQEEA